MGDFMVRWLRVSLCAFVLLGIVQARCLHSLAAQTPSAKKKVSSETDLPRFSYPITGTASGLLTADDATFEALTRKVSADLESMLADYDIEDKATLRSLMGTKLDIQMLLGDSEGATSTLVQLRDLQEKPSTRAMSG